LNVAVVGGGPAGVSACLELSKSPNLKIVLFESDEELGKIPPTQHIFLDSGIGKESIQDGHTLEN